MKINPGETTHLFKWLPRNKQMRPRRMGKGIWRVIFCSLLNFWRCLILARLSSPGLFSPLFLCDLVCFETLQIWHHYFESFSFCFWLGTHSRPDCCTRHYLQMSPQCAVNGGVILIASTAIEVSSFRCAAPFSFLFLSFFWCHCTIT